MYHDEQGNWIQPHILKEYAKPDVDYAMDVQRYMVSSLIGKTVHVSIDPGQKVTGVNYFVQGDSMRDNSIDHQVAMAIQDRRNKVLLEQKLALVEQYGDDELENGTILHFFKQFNADLPRDLPAGTFEYVGLKVVNKWFLTGSLMGFTRGTWDQFVLALIGGDHPVSPDAIEVLSTANSHPFKYSDDSDVAQNYEQEKRDWPPIAETQVIPKHIGVASREHSGITDRDDGYVDGF